MSKHTLQNKGQIHITTDNWPKFLNKSRNTTETSGNPVSKDFDWLFFAGITNKEDFKKLKKSYSRASTLIDNMYDLEPDYLKNFIKQYEKNEVQQEIILQSFKNIKEVLKKLPLEKDKKKLFFRIAMTFYMENYKKNIYFSEGEEYLLLICSKIANFTDPNQCQNVSEFCEPFTFLLYKAFLITCKLKSFLFPNVKLSVGSKTYKFYKKKELSRPHFFCFVIAYMFIKTRPEVVSDLFKQKSSRKMKFFNEFIQQIFSFFIFNLPFKLGLDDDLNFKTKEIFGTLLKKKDPMVLATYIIAYFKKNVDKNLKMKFPALDEEVTHLKQIVGEFETTGRSDTLEEDKKSNPETATKLVKKMCENIGFTDKSKTFNDSHLITHPIPNEEVKKIEEYFKNNLSKIVKTAKSKLVKKKDKTKKQTKITYGFPEKLLKKSILQSGGKKTFVKTIKKKKSKKNITFKKY